jgi:hypothetical protein
MGAGKLAELANLPSPAAIAVAAAAFVLAMPITLLSALLEGSPIGVLSPRLLSSLGRCAGPWLLFYVQSFMLAAVTGAAAWALAPRTPGTLPPAFVWGVTPIALAALIIDMRLLGRLAWWISDKMPTEEADRSDNA